jgi:predicted metalloprotease
MAAFLTSVLTDVDGFWAGVFANAGMQENTVNFVFPGPGESVTSACNGGMQSDDNSAFYCPADDTIVVSTDFANRVWQGQVTADPNNTASYASGDFSVALVIAHEYAHSLQAHLGLDASETRKTELQADCLAGVWGNSAYYKGILEAGDVEEGVAALELIGDYDYSSPDHHGTPAERVDAFMTGYNSGQGNACDGYLA